VVEKDARASAKDTSSRSCAALPQAERVMVSSISAVRIMIFFKVFHSVGFVFFRFCMLF